MIPLALEMRWSAPLLSGKGKMTVEWGTMMAKVATTTGNWVRGTDLRIGLTTTRVGIHTDRILVTTPRLRLVDPSRLPDDESLDLPPVNGLARHFKDVLAHPTVSVAHVLRADVILALLFVPVYNLLSGNIRDRHLVFVINLHLDREHDLQVLGLDRALPTGIYAPLLVLRFSIKTRTPQRFDFLDPRNWETN